MLRQVEGSSLNYELALPANVVFFHFVCMTYETVQEISTLYDLKATAAAMLAPSDVGIETGWA